MVPNNIFPNYICGGRLESKEEGGSMEQSPGSFWAYKASRDRTPGGLTGRSKRSKRTT